VVTTAHDHSSDRAAGVGATSPYVNIRKHWNRSSRSLAACSATSEFFNLRLTGVSHIAQRGKPPAHLLAAVGGAQGADCKSAPHEG
jgi:hypothetical protein